MVLKKKKIWRLPVNTRFEIYKKSSLINPPLGNVHAFFVMAALQCEADEQALASTAYSVAGLRSISEHSSGFKEAGASQDFPPPVTL